MVPSRPKPRNHGTVKNTSGYTKRAEACLRQKIYLITILLILSPLLIKVIPTPNYYSKSYSVLV